MNIFYLDRDEKLCAQAHCDKHVNKMILEGAQLLASAHWMTGSKEEGLYRLTHKNHPCAVWVRQSLNNYAYLFSLMYELNEEAKIRYGHNRDHKSFTRAWAWGVPDALPNTPFTEPPKCVHDDFKGYKDTVEAYRAYYCRDKKDIATWTNRQPPQWFLTGA